MAFNTINDNPLKIPIFVFTLFRFYDNRIYPRSRVCICVGVYARAPPRHMRVY